MVTGKREHMTGTEGVNNSHRPVYLTCSDDPFIVFYDFELCNGVWSILYAPYLSLILLVCVWNPYFFRFLLSYEKLRLH